MFLCLFVFSVLKLRSCFVYSFIGLFKAEWPPPTSPPTAVSSSTSTTPAVASSNHQSISLVSFHYLQHSMSHSFATFSKIQQNNKQFNKIQRNSHQSGSLCSFLCSVFSWDMNLKVKVKLKVEFARTTLQQDSCYNMLTRGGDSHFLTTEWIIGRENFLCKI